jgi:hypothetical protein
MYTAMLRFIITAVLIILPLYSYAGVIEVFSEPKDAQVYIDGAYVGDTPYKDKEILAGTHKVLATYDDYPPQHQYVTVTEGSPQTVTFVFGKKAYSGVCVKAEVEGTCWKGIWKGYKGERNETMYLYFINGREAKLRLFETYPIDVKKDCDGSLFKNTRGNIVFTGRIKDDKLEVDTFNYTFLLRTTVTLAKDNPEACKILTEPEPSKSD